MGRKKLDRKIGTHSESNMAAALDAIKKGKSIRKAATDCEIPYATVRRYYSKMKNMENMPIRLTPFYDINRVFTHEQEDLLKTYYTHCAQLFYGLSRKEARVVAYQMAQVNKIKMPPSWQQNEIAGEDWFRGFRQRHPDISLKKPERCSLARATGFNRHNVNIFYDNLETAIMRWPEVFADGTRIFNLDETSTTNVQKPNKVVASKSLHISKVTSGEKGILVTTCCIISASGQALPPVMVFPRVNFLPKMLKGAPSGSLGLATSSGWMNTTLFIEVMKHFVKHSNSSIENPSILILDNHESHLSIEALNIAKASGVTIVTLHPHTSHRLQPLDVGVFGPFKTFYNSSIDSWMLRNPGIPLTIYEVGEMVGYAFPRAMTPVNIIKSFQKTGIYPFDRNVFNDEDFLPSTVTDRPIIDQEPILSGDTIDLLPNSLAISVDQLPSCSGNNSYIELFII